jgi:UDP-N-acetylmuramoyl-L-alanyl-D-glutamate--2,6-diaminopimelate ligase
VRSDRLFIAQSVDGPLPAELAGVSRDSRTLRVGEVFIAQSEGTERTNHVAEARARGAAAILAEPAVPHARWAFARASCAAHGLPGSLRVLATTGTKGKSTVTHFAHAALGPGAARIGTIGWHDGVSERPNPQTTPPPDHLHDFLADLPADCPGVAIEASSHGLDQHRLAGLTLSALAVTNIGRDHLDYHGSTAAYVHAKLRAARLLRSGGLCVVNADDEHASRFAHAAQCAGARVVALAVGRGGHPRLPGCEQATAFRRGPGWVLDAPGAEVDLPLRLPGGFNAWNAAAAVLMAEAAGVPIALAAKRLGDAPPVPGRLELLARVPLTYVDYAHTPESLAAAIAALREAHPGRRLAVAFGCGGDRDSGKRAPMGTAASAADVVVLTDDNPRSEDPAAIVAQIRAGCTADCHVAHERGAAIDLTRSLAGPDGVALVCGKGHETEQKFRGRVINWDDRAYVRGLERVSA